MFQFPSTTADEGLDEDVCGWIALCHSGEVADSDSVDLCGLAWEPGGEAGERQDNTQSVTLFTGNIPHQTMVRKGINKPSTNKVKMSLILPFYPLFSGGFIVGGWCLIQCLVYC